MREVARQITDDSDSKQVRFGNRSALQKPSADELLIKAHLRTPVSDLHIRRTLDQSFYRTIDTEFRDKTQVVVRWAQRHTGAQDPLKVLMVDQLWMWIVGKDLLVTSFPQRWQQPREDPLNVLESTLEEINSRDHEAVENIYDLAVMIGGRCFGTFDRASITRDGSRFLDMFEASIGVAMDKETTLFSNFKEASQQVSLDLQKKLLRAESLDKVGTATDDTTTVWQASQDVRKLSHHKQKAIETLLDIGLETELLSEVKDIRDELDMLSMVFDQQIQVLDQANTAMDVIMGAPDEELNDTIKAEKRKVAKRLEHNRRAVEHSKKEIERMDKQADRIYKSMRDLLDLKQKYANAIEARYSRIQAEETARQGKEMARQGQETQRQGQTLKIFTIVTVIFLPLSFIAAFFAIDIDELPHIDDTQAMRLSYVAKFVFGIGLSFAVLCVILALVWDKLGAIATRLLVWLFPGSAAAQRARKERQSLLDLRRMNHTTAAEPSGDAVAASVRSRSWKKYSALQQPNLDDHFVGFQV